MIDPQAKAGDLVSDVYLAFVRRLPCYFCVERPPTAPHHHPPKGRGIWDDSKTIPTCVRCHQRCHGITVVLDNGTHAFPISEGEQTRAVDATLRRFLAEASHAEASAFFDDLTRWRSRPTAIPW